MTPEELPVVGPVFRFGTRDPFFGWLLLLGPVVVALFVLLGRSIVTESIAALYVLAVPLYVLRKAVRG